MNAPAIITARRRLLTLRPLDEIISRLGLSTGLVLCLDAAAVGCYGGTGQTLTDLSGSGNDYQLGATSGSEASDPTFAGVAGDLLSTTYFSGDGADYFTPVAATTFDHPWVKDGAQFTVVSVLYLPDVITAAQNVVGNTSGIAAQARIEISTAEKLIFQVLDDAGGVELNTTSTAGFVTSAWNFMAVSENENGGAGASIRQMGATQETFNGAYASPSATDPTSELLIWKRGASSNIAQSGTRFGVMAAWSRNLSAVELERLRIALRAGRFPTI